MAIKNYTSDKPIDRIFAELQQTLGTHGAKHISFEYGDDGKVQGLAFTIKVNDRFIPIKLPARVEKAQAVLKNNGKMESSHISAARKTSMATSRLTVSPGAISSIGYLHKWRC